MNYLSVDTARWISSSQIVTSVSSVVKELFENALDAESRNITVKLENFGLDLIEVKDDGTGISGDNVHKMFLPGYTSKISDFKDLDTLSTYGFRGEALGALCRLGDTSITTKTDRDTVAMTYVINCEGAPICSVPSHLPRGTTVSVKNLFKALPVRKQFASSKKKMAEELKRVEGVVQSLAVIHPHLRVVLTHNKTCIWQKNSVNTLKQSFAQVIGIRHSSKMEYLKETQGDMSVELIVPMKTACDVEALFTASVSHSFVFVNKRPVSYKEVTKLIDEITHQFFQKEGKHVTFLASVTVPPHEVDVNLEPNKTRVLLRNLPDLITLILNSLQSYYGCVLNQPKPPEETKEDIAESDEDLPSKRAKLDDSFQIEEKEYRKPETGATSEPSNSICSQINKDNCVLASEAEVSDLNEKLNANRQAVVTLPSNAMRVEIQENLGGKILPSWPVRQNTPVKSFPVFESSCDNRERETTTPSVPETHIELPSFNHDHSNVNLDPTSMESTQEYFDKVLSSIEHSKKKPELCVGDWSRGQVSLVNGKKLDGGAALVTPGQVSLGTGKNLQGVVAAATPVQVSLDHGKNLEFGAAVVTPGQTRLESDGVSGGPEVVGSELAEDVAKFNLSIQSVSSQMGKKELSGFTKFARIMRPKIIEENPSILFTEVSRLLVERWQMLTFDEKEYYESVAKGVDEERKRKKAVAQPARPPAKPVRANVQTTVRPDRRQVLVPLTLDHVIKVRSSPTRQELKKLSLIGRLVPNGEWLYHRDLEIGHIHHTALSELVLYHKMLLNYKLPTKKLDRHLHVTESELGQREWNVLTSLQTEYVEQTCRYIVTSPGLINNGLGIELLKTTTGDVTTVFLTEVAADLEDYGLADLKEALQLYQQNGPSSPMNQLRTTAVKNYIEKEVVRIVGANNGAPGRGEMASLLRTWQQDMGDLPAKCLHGREIFVPIFHSQV